MLLDRVMADQLIMQKKKNLKHIKMRWIEKGEMQQKIKLRSE